VIQFNLFISFWKYLPRWPSCRAMPYCCNVHQGNAQLVTTTVTIQLLTTLDVAWL